MNNTTLPDWLVKEQKYIPQKDKDAFINKSILSVLGVLSRVRAQATHREGSRQAHAAIKLAFTLLVVVLLSLSRSFSFVLVVVVGLLCALSLLPARELARVLRNSAFAAVFTAAVLLPTVFMGNWYSITMLTPKVFASVTVLGLLSLGTRWNELTGALKVFFIPDIFIFVLDITIKYILLLGEYTLNMLYALRLRSVGKNSGKYTSLSGIAGTMFTRSREMADEMHSAMECRGFTGEYRRPARFTFNSLDALVTALAAAAVLLFIYLR
jgi:cobalt/nickel transport system permease protein